MTGSPKNHTTLSLSPGKLLGLRRMATESGIFSMTAVDQRPPIKGPIAKALGREEAPWEDVAGVKKLLIETLQPASSALLLDPHYAIPIGFDTLRPDTGLVVTLEDSLFEETEGGRLSSTIDDWSVAKIKRMGGDAVKVLAWYHPDATDRVRHAQQDFVKRIGEACNRCDIPFLLELLVYPLPGDRHQTGDYVEMKGKRTEDVLASVAEFARDDYGVDVFKLESPVNAEDADGSRAVQDAFDELGRLAGRPWVMLSAGAGKDQFFRILEHAFAAGASGFLAGRAIWLDAFSAYPDWEKMRRELETDGLAYLNRIGALADSNAHPWHRHACYGADGGGARFAPADSSFRHSYAGL